MGNIALIIGSTRQDRFASYLAVYEWPGPSALSRVSRLT